MMPYPDGWTGFRKALRERGHSYVTVTSSDDLCVVVVTIRTMLDPDGIRPRIFYGRDHTLHVEAA